MREQITQVMLVDDDPDDLGFAREAFDRSGAAFEYTTFTTGRSAMNHLHTAPLVQGQRVLPHIIISDLRVPDCDGLELLKFVKSDDALSHIPVIIMSSAHHPATEAKCRKSGVAGFFIKPFTIEGYDNWLLLITPLFQTAVSTGHSERF